jgi:cytoskeleton protein RodZ
MRGARGEDRDPAQSLMREVGAQLRQTRLERGEDLNDVAQHLRIKSSYLFGIEQGDLSALPGRAYALGFLRSYADYLGFDGEDLITRIKSTVENLTNRTSLRVRTPLPENRLPKTPMVVISLAVVAGVYAGWSYLNHSTRTMVDTVAEVPSDLRARTVEAMPRESGEAPLAADSAIEGAGSAAAPGTAPGADPSGAAAAQDPAASAAASTAEAEPPAATPGATGDAGAPPGSAQPRAAPDRLAAPEAGPSVEERSSTAQGVVQDGLSVQPAAGAASSERARAPAVGSRSDTRDELALSGTPSPTARVASDQSGSAAGPDIAAAVSSARDVLSLTDPTVGGPDTPQASERINADARVILRARERAWIQVSSPAGDYVFTRTLEPGEAFLVPDRSDLELWTGNAGGLEIIVDGTPVPALAGGGAVRRHVSLDPDRLLAAAEQPR